MKIQFFSRFAGRVTIAMLALLALVTPLRASAQIPVAPIVGPWVVTEATDAANVGLRFYFSPDGIFLLVDPKSQLGATGSYSLGRAGLTINVYGYGKAAYFLNGDALLTGDTLVIDVKRSEFMGPQRIVLKRIRMALPTPGVPAAPTTAPPAAK
jgi:hypothetical protein